MQPTLASQYSRVSNGFAFGIIVTLSGAFYSTLEAGGGQIQGFWAPLVFILVICTVYALMKCTATSPVFVEAEELCKRISNTDVEEGKS